MASTRADRPLSRMSASAQPCVGDLRSSCCPPEPTDDLDRDHSRDRRLAGSRNDQHRDPSPTRNPAYKERSCVHPRHRYAAHPLWWRRDRMVQLRDIGLAPGCTTSDRNPQALVDDEARQEACTVRESRLARQLAVAPCPPEESIAIDGVNSGNTAAFRTTGSNDAGVRSKRLRRPQRIRSVQRRKRSSSRRLRQTKCQKTGNVI